MDSKNFPTLYLEHSFPGSATSLFDAWTSPSVAELWLFQDAEEMNFIADVKEGGEFHAVQKHATPSVGHSGHYIKIDRPKELIFSLAAPGHFEGLSEVKIEIEEGPGGCKLKFSQRKQDSPGNVDIPGNVEDTGNVYGRGNVKSSGNENNSGNVDSPGNVESWEAMFGLIQKILASPYVITNASDKKEIISAINVVLMQMTGFVMSLPGDLINKVPFKGSWTAGQLIRHIIKSLNGMSAIMSKPGEPAKREITKRVIELKQAFLDLTINMQSPEFIVPESKMYERDRLLNDLQNCLKQLKDAVSTADMSEIVKGLPFGEVTKIEILHFVLYHSQRHLFQMKKITDALKLQK